MRKIVFIALVAAVIVPQILIGAYYEDPYRIKALEDIKIDVTPAEFWTNWDNQATKTKMFIEGTFTNPRSYSSACNSALARIMNKAVAFASTQERYKELRTLIEAARTSPKASEFWPAFAAADLALTQKETPARSPSFEDENAALKAQIAALQKRIEELEKAAQAEAAKQAKVEQAEAAEQEAARKAAARKEAIEIAKKYDRFKPSFKPSK